jgi:hypothetical protein
METFFAPKVSGAHFGQNSANGRRLAASGGEKRQAARGRGWKAAKEDGNDEGKRPGGGRTGNWKKKAMRKKGYNFD